MAGTFFASSFLKEITKESERLRKKEGFSRDGEKGEETQSVSVTVPACSLNPSFFGNVAMKSDTCHSRNDHLNCRLDIRKLDVILAVFHADVQGNWTYRCCGSLIKQTDHSVPSAPLLFDGLNITAKLASYIWSSPFLARTIHLANIGQWTLLKSSPKVVIFV
ncbi:hypothetical protein Cgig2_005812 [Carnegiea gigantea]|uniref:Uncharacterized protein n=1 Tax=Carnegiea gigantea TaxID=171969 RepID=A0A9Q1QLT4_9CARY|nr:hypothetical protein Cgig2_005812 [Carnegiea gigantea]